MSGAIELSTQEADLRHNAGEITVVLFIRQTSVGRSHHQGAEREEEEFHGSSSSKVDLKAIFTETPT